MFSMADRRIPHNLDVLCQGIHATSELGKEVLRALCFLPAYRQAGASPLWYPTPAKEPARPALRGGYPSSFGGQV
jgi:hypothetical protein